MVAFQSKKSKAKLLSGGVIKPEQVTTGVIEVETVASGAMLPISTGGGVISGGDTPVTPKYALGEYIKFEQTADAKVACPLDYCWNTQDTQEIKFTNIRSVTSLYVLQRDERNNSSADDSLSIYVTHNNVYPNELRYEIGRYNSGWTYAVNISSGKDKFPLGTTKTVRFSGKNIYFDGVINTPREITFNHAITDMPICLAGLVHNGGISGIGNDDALCFYYLKVTNSSGELIHNYVPALRKTDNAYVIRDLVTETDFEFLGNTSAITKFVEK